MPWPTPIGNLDETAIRELANIVKTRAIAHRPKPIYVHADHDPDVFAVIESPALMFDPAHTPVGTYTNKATTGEIAADLICARDEAMAERRGC